MKIAIGSDHAGFEVKKELIDFLRDKGHQVVDFGTNSTASCDYPDIAYPLAKSVVSGENERGILICGTGVGIGIVANKVNGIRCALCANSEVAKLCRMHNNANVISMGARVISVDEMKAIITSFLTTEFEGGRHQARIDKITKVEIEQRK